MTLAKTQDSTGPDVTHLPSTSCDRDAYPYCLSLLIGSSIAAPDQHGSDSLCSFAFDDADLAFKTTKAGKGPDGNIAIKVTSR